MGTGDYGQLPFTGGGIALGGVLLSQSEVVGIAVLVVAIGAALIRLGMRRNRSIEQA